MINNVTPFRKPKSFDVPTAIAVDTTLKAAAAPAATFGVAASLALVAAKVLFNSANLLFSRFV